MVSPVVLSSATLCPASPSLRWVPWASVPHLLGHCPDRPRPAVLCLAKTALCPSQVTSLVARGPIPGLLPWFVSPLRARGQPEALCQRQGSWSAGTPSLPAFLTRRQTALSSSRITPLSACPALRPRWCPAHLASRLRDCCLPGAANRRLSLSASTRGYPPRTTTILISGLDHTACTLATPGFVPPFTGTHAGSLLAWCHPLVRSDLSRSPRNSPTG
jgi:hypothetical protein